MGKCRTFRTPFPLFLAVELLLQPHFYMLLTTASAPQQFQAEMKSTSQLSLSGGTLALQRLLLLGLSNAQGKHFLSVGFIPVPKNGFFVPSQRLLFRDTAPGVLWLWNKHTSCSTDQDTLKGISTARNCRISVAAEDLRVPQDCMGCSSLRFLSTASSLIF